MIEWNKERGFFMYQILVCDDDHDIVSALEIYLTGEGYGVTGASGGFGLLAPGLKYVMMFDMLAGRLELFAFLALLLPAFWRK